MLLDTDHAIQIKQNYMYISKPEQQNKGQQNNIRTRGSAVNKIGIYKRTLYFRVSCQVCREMKGGLFIHNGLWLV